MRRDASAETVAAPVAGSGIVGGCRRLIGVSFRVIWDCVASGEKRRWKPSRPRLPAAGPLRPPASHRRLVSCDVGLRRIRREASAETIAASVAGSGTVGGSRRLIGVSFRVIWDCVASSEKHRRKPSRPGCRQRDGWRPRRLIGVSFRAIWDCVASGEKRRRQKLDWLPAIRWITGACVRQRKGSTTENRRRVPYWALSLTMILMSPACARSSRNTSSACARAATHWAAKPASLALTGSMSTTASRAAWLRASNASGVSASGGGRMAAKVWMSR